MKFYKTKLLIAMIINHIYNNDIIIDDMKPPRKCGLTTHITETGIVPCVNQALQNIFGQNLSILNK